MTTEIQPPPSKNEALKSGSEGLAGTLFTEIADGSTDQISGNASNLLKFHGSYQQDDRDARAAKRGSGGGRQWQFMVRTKCPGGRMTAEQYLLADELADTHGNGTLRLTTRQGIQFHGVGKQHLKSLIKTLNERWVTTYGACGDVARNVLTCPVDDLLPGSAHNYQALAKQISDRFLPESTAYYELWLDGEKVLEDGRRVQVTPKRDESFYGSTYMPRKHKIGIGMPQDNCIDIFTHDLALEAVPTADGGLAGFNLLAGGGLGMTHGQRETFPRLGDKIGFFRPEEAMEAIEAASAIYRDTGDRKNRRHARLKYVLADRGVEWFREEMARRLGRPVELPAATPEYDVNDHLGWTRQADGNWMVGVWIESGRIQDAEQRRWRTGLREAVKYARGEVRLTAQQNLVITGITPRRKAKVARILAEHGLSAGDGLSTLRRYAMACPALPTCGLAVAESERAMPGLIDVLEERGYGNERVWIRTSGCPNGCSRPPTAEIGIVGRSLGLYHVYVGGDFEGTRLTHLYKPDVKIEALPDVIGEALDRWRAERQEGEAFGDWSDKAL